MIRAIVLVQAADPRPGAAQDVALAIRELIGVSAVDATAGPYDTVVGLDALGPRDLAVRVTEIQELPEVGRTLTLPCIELDDDNEQEEAA